MATLYIVPTPIGNLEDISLRALRILREEVNTIFCEDTRVTSKLLNHYQVEGKKLISYNKENEKGKIKLIEQCLINSEDVALCSDAGTPLISDPGQELVSHLYEAGFQVVPLPGASALTTALSACPINTERFTYEGFLPHGPKQRRRVLRDLLEEKRPLVFFESPHRITKTLEDISNIFSEEAEVFLARELSKKFEEFYHGPVTQVLEKLKQQFPKDVQGEFVLVLKSHSF